MKAIKITMLCLLVLIQGISQSYAAQMMANMSMSNISEQQDMRDMPCHQASQSTSEPQSVVMNDCCEQDCQCHFLFSAMTQRGFSFQAVQPSNLFDLSHQGLFSHTAQNLYRPPIFA